MKHFAVGQRVRVADWLPAACKLAALSAALACGMAICAALHGAYPERGADRAVAATMGWCALMVLASVLPWRRENNRPHGAADTGTQTGEQHVRDHDQD